ncbi:nuclear pore complex component-domain-containing protein [Cladorrhinum samala]|uniref:Nuclear pore complex component-domain-containing protein n=1 Tax=Cladorrhinum samala TaxID=585594 RepID=A0AAV9I1I2_9PEZI|nr:nuclear pore complex component-domain-containing protein [Cladorrhinum samala]
MATPVKQIARADASVKESPGNWKHPKLQEITRRQNRTTFSEKNVLQIAYNVAIMAGLHLLRQWVLPLTPFRFLISSRLPHVSVLLFLIPIVNITLALLPLVRRKDDLSDLALTPAQRELLGLPQSSAPPTPNSVYSTPPRYSRTPSLAGSPASIKSYSSSPLSNLASPSSLGYSPSKWSSNSPTKLIASQLQYSPVSPLLQKAIAGGAGRRSSFGSGSALGASTASNFGASTASSFGASTASSFFGDGPPTPTPVNGKRSSVALNSKWLYERGRRNSSNNWLHQSMS